jgi:hypothetical protein
VTALTTASRPDDGDFAMQLLDLPPRGWPPFDRFKHRHDVHRLPRIRASHQKAFQAFAAFVAHTLKVWPLRAASRRRSITRTCESELRFNLCRTR